LFGHLLQSPFFFWRRAAWLYQKLGVQKRCASGILKLFGKLTGGAAGALGRITDLFRHYGKVFLRRRGSLPGMLLGGCIANVFFARLNEATVRVLVKNGCR
jgi:glycolate oxidase iron-sulfur subunit